MSLARTLQSFLPRPRSATEKTGEARAGPPARRIPSVCQSCVNTCGIVLKVRNGVVVGVEGNAGNPHNYGRICAKGIAAVMGLYDPHRVLVPLKRTNPVKGIGVDPGWEPVEPAEALDIVVHRLRRVLEDDPRKLVILSGTGDPESVNAVIGAFAEAFGTPNAGTGTPFGAKTWANYLNTGSMHTEPDFEHCRYLMLFGSQKGAMVGHDTIKAAGAMAEARRRGMKLVVCDPVCTPTASKADEWIPIRPGTDRAMALAMLNVLLNELNVYDAEFLRAQTNACYLVGEDGRYERDASGKPMVWDRAQGAAGPYDAAEDPALLGNYEIGGNSCRPAFQLLRDHLRQYSPEAVAPVTDVPAATIRRLAGEFAASAGIGSTIVIEGRRLPLRPVCAFPDCRGLAAHMHGVWTSTAVQLLNVVVGAVDVPGGNLSTNVVGPHGRFRVGEGPEGLVTSGPELGNRRPYPARAPKAPETVDLGELFPVGRSPRPLLAFGLSDYASLLPYRPEMIVHCSSNAVMVAANPEKLAAALGRVPFMVSLAHTIDETVELADIVLPVQHTFERLDFPVNSLRGWVTGDHWYFTLRQPGTAPAPAVKHIAQLFLEFGERLRLGKKINAALNAKLRLREEHRLEENRIYHWEEILDRSAKSAFGDDRGLDWLREHGLVAWPRSLGERYPRAVHRLPRLPVYFEHFLEVRPKIEALIREAGLDWDLSGYQALPFWKPCPAAAQRDRGYDLMAVNFKFGFHAFSTTERNPWLDEITTHHPWGYRLIMNADTARRKGIADGDRVVVESCDGKRATGTVRLTQGIHPEVLGIAACFGRWSRGEPAARGKGVHYNSLVPHEMSWIDTFSGHLDACAPVRIERARDVP
ncbi:MAG TPA: molybdopterin-dependent oxidoreductase [candidate division Zixibacteria bacterium]|nr:molybdopterin-dependent oxidoreductase [candidate division Zixibacteria bacterium]